MQGLTKIGEAFEYIVIVLMVSVPLSVWKLVDIAIWVYKNVQIKIN